MKKTLTAYEKRVLEIPQKQTKFDKPEEIALLKMIEAMPWLLEVAENKFDPNIANMILQREGLNMRNNLETDAYIKQYKKAKAKD